MIGHLRGSLLHKTPGLVLVDCGGVGYRVAVSMSSYADLPEVGGEASLWIHTVVREDVLALYGFRSQDERAIFLRLIKVNGVGAKLALAVLSGARTDEIRTAVTSGDVTWLTRLPGIGKKTAERIVVELRDKLEPAATADVKLRPPGSAADDVVSALVNLGYKSQVAEAAIDSARKSGASEEFEALLRASLTSLSR